MKLRIDGVRGFYQRLRIFFDEFPIYLPWSQFRLLTILAAYRLRFDDKGWVPKDLICKRDTRMADSYLYILRSQLKQVLGDKASGLIEADRHGNFRLAIPAENINIDYTYMKSLADDHVMAEALRLPSQDSQP